jgi:hypothetical protein
MEVHEVNKSADPPHDAAKESNLPSRGLPGPASFEDWMGHQARAAPGRILGPDYETPTMLRWKLSTVKWAVPTAEPPPVPQLSATFTVMWWTTAVGR